MINRKAIVFNFEVTAHALAAQEISRDIAIPGTVTVDDPKLGQGYFGQSYKDSNVVKRVSSGLVFFSVIGDAELIISYYMVNPAQGEILLFTTPPLNGSAPVNFLFDPDDQAPPPLGTDWDLIVKTPMTFDTIRMKADVTGTGNAAMFYACWLAAS